MPDLFDTLLESWRIEIRARDLSRKTETIYIGAGRDLAARARAAGLTSWDQVDRAAIREHIAALVERTSASNGSVNFRALQQLFKWLAEEEEIDANTMAGMKGPNATVHPVPVFADDDLRRLLDSLTGRDYRTRRDNAIVRTFLDTGVRRSELTGIDLTDLDLAHREVVVTGKGRRTRTVKYGVKTAKALDRYLRIRATHPSADHLDALWLAPGRADRMTHSGIAQVLARRGDAVGVHIHPHRFRHHFAHEWLDQGGAEGDLMEITGWTSEQMLRRYGASARSARARRAYDRVQIGNRY